MNSRHNLATKNRMWVILMAAITSIITLISGTTMIKFAAVTTAASYTFDGNLYANELRGKSLSVSQHCPNTEFGERVNRYHGNNRYSSRLIPKRYSASKVFQGRNKKYYCEYPVGPRTICEPKCSAKTVGTNTYACICSVRSIRSAY